MFSSSRYSKPWRFPKHISTSCKWTLSLARNSLSTSYLFLYGPFEYYIHIYSRSPNPSLPLRFLKQNIIYISYLSHLPYFLIFSLIIAHLIWGMTHYLLHKPLSLPQSKTVKKIFLAFIVYRGYIYKACVKVFFILQPELKLEICKEKELCDACRKIPWQFI
jgi:hypothetical protein